jgi:hypothetical protein
MSPRATLTADPPAGDYILSSAGPSWNIRRSNGSGSMLDVSPGEPDRKTAFAKIRTLSGAENVDAWETTGNGSFWLVHRARRT